MSTQDQARALSEHTAKTKPHHLDTSTQNDYEKAPGRWNAPAMSLTEARAKRHEEIRKANAKAKPAQPTQTVEEAHQELVERRRASGNAQSFNRKSFRQQD
jgi:hypothetical protein